MADLKPCPFCGRTPTVDDCGDHRYFVRCKCGIAQDKLYMQKCDAIRRWNTRKTGKIDKDTNAPSTDCISRQAAIEAIKSLSITLDAETVQRSIEAVSNMPSAQPEPIRLRLDHELSKEEYERLKKDCAEQPVILLPKEPAQSGWIPCSERLPEPGGYYLVTRQYFGWNCTEYRDIDIARYDFDGWHKADTVLAWYELPKPWEGEKGG